MAVYTQIGAEAMAALIAEFDVGALVSAKGIAEGVSNSNWLVETTGRDGGGARFILTMYEYRIDIAELPFFLRLLDYLSGHDCPVPRTIHDRAGNLSRTIAGKEVALIEFLPGLSVSTPRPAQARAVGEALARMHLATAAYPEHRANAMGLAEWQRLADACKADGLASIAAGLPDFVGRQLGALADAWPSELPRAVIHADLFPDNVLMLGDKVSGLIDFYFACTDFAAYDVAVTHAAWCFDGEGRRFDPAVSAALLDGYETERPLSAKERAALPLLARGAAMRFLTSRAYDWIHTPPTALVTRKDPLAFARRLEFYADPANAGVFA